MFAFKQLLSLSVLFTLITLASAACPGPTWVVKANDTCQKIADASSMAVTTLQALNPGLDCTNLFVGQVRS
jgi:LysM repeat protein